MNRRQCALQIGGVLAALAWLLAAPVATAGKAKGRAKAPFINTGVLPTAAGDLEFEGKDGEQELEFELYGLNTGPTYEMYCDGRLWTTFQADSRGRAKFYFESIPQDAHEQLLMQDPRGKTFVITDGVQPILTAILSAPGEPAGSEVSQRGSLEPTGLGPPKFQTKSVFYHRRGGQRTWLLIAQKLPAGTWKLTLDGEELAEVEVEKDGGKLKLSFSDPLKSSKDMHMDFDPRDGVLELEGPGGVFGTNNDGAAILGLDSCPQSEVVSALTASGAGQGMSTLKIDDDCHKVLLVEIEGVPEGDYDVWVDKVLRGTLQAAFDAGEGKVVGAIEWDTDPDDPHEMPLDFEPRDARVEVMQGATLFFSGIQARPPKDPPPGPCTESETQRALLNTGAIAGARGRVDLDVDDDCDESFEVEIQDVPAGNYEVKVGGVMRGTLEAVLNPATGKVWGKLEWEDDPDDPGEMLLNFDPRGQAVEVFDGGTKILERTFPS